MNLIVTAECTWIMVVPQLFMESELRERQDIILNEQLNIRTSISNMSWSKYRIGQGRGYSSTWERGHMERSSKEVELSGDETMSESCNQIQYYKANVGLKYYQSLISKLECASSFNPTFHHRLPIASILDYHSCYSK